VLSFAATVQILQLTIRIFHTYVLAKCANEERIRCSSIIILRYLHTHFKRVSFHHGMARPQAADVGDFLQIWRVAANILNKQSRTADNGWPHQIVC
jgi:hypothetical protein